MRAFSQHEHFDVEDPAFGVHVGDDVGEGWAGEEFEAALGIFDACGGGRGHDAEEEVERVHEEVSEARSLDDGGAADQVRARPDGHAAAVLVFDALAALDESSEVREAAGAVGVGEDNVAPTDVPHAVGHGAAFASVLLQADDADAAVGDMR